MDVKCVYCNSKEELSVSDIIPDSMTSAKLKAKIVCKYHNNLTNSQFENSFANFFSFFRNRLGYLDRRNGKEIRFRADIYANDVLVLPNCYLASLENFFKTKVFFDTNGNYHLVNVNPKYTKIINPEISYKVQINWEDLFLSIVSQRTIAKISYEFHCYNNHINQKEDRYDNIIDFILNEGASSNSPVEIINDDIFDEITKDSFNYIDGAHCLLEYSENHKRYVICSMFGSIWYRVFICDDFESKYEDKTMFLFLLDGTFEKHKSTAVGVSGFINGQIGKLENNLFFFPYAISINSIKDRKSFLEPKIKPLTSIINGVIITISQIKRYNNLLKKINYTTLTTQQIKQFVMFQESSKVMALLCFYCLRKIPIKNYTSKELLSYFTSSYSLINESNQESILFDKSFILEVKKGVDAFTKLLNKNMIAD